MGIELTDDERKTKYSSAELQIIVDCLDEAIYYLPDERATLARAVREASYILTQLPDDLDLSAPATGAEA